MDVACQHCPSVYPISEQKLAGRLVRFRCKSCGNAIVVDGRQNPSRPPAGVTSVPPLSLANIASSVAPQEPVVYQAPAIVGVALPKQPAAAPLPAVSTPLASESVQVPRLSTLSRGASDKPMVPPPFPSGMGINQTHAPVTVPLSSPPSAAAPRTAPSEPTPAFRTASQPHNPNPQEVDPSVYEDETVAMTATELEAAADAQSHLPDSEPQIPLWAANLSQGMPPAMSPPLMSPPVMPPSAMSPSAMSAAPPTPPAITPPPPANPWNSLAHHSGGFSASHPSVSGVGTSSGIQASFGEAHSPVSISSPAFDFDPINTAPRPTRAESWSIGKNAAATDPFTAQEWRGQPTPAPASGRTLASAEPPPSDNPWLFRGLLVVLGIGGVVLGGVLGNTWLRHLLPASGSEGEENSQGTEVMNPHLPGFDALGANERLEAAQTEALNCLSADTPPLTGLLIARFRPTGELEALTLTGSVGTSAQTPCIRSVFDKVEVPPFRGVTSQVEKALELRPRP